MLEGFSKLARLPKLSLIPRTGWCLRGVPPALCEDVASHSFLTALVSLFLSSKARECGLSPDVGKVLAMAVAHDLPELVTGDIPRPVKQGLGERARELERRALEELGLGELGQLVEELEEGRTLEALIVRVSDDLATMLRAALYMEQGYKGVSDLLLATRDSIKRAASEGKRLTNECFSSFLEELVAGV